MSSNDADVSRALAGVRVRVQELAERKWLPYVLLLVAALLATLAYGQGNIIGEGQADLHVDPLQFLRELLYTWDARLYLGSHNGFTQVYMTPYGLLYGLLALVHLHPELAQRIVILLINCWLAAGMYWALGFIVPGINVYGRIAGAAAYLFNIYVAFNSQGSIPMLLPYGSLPWLIGALAAALDGVWPPFAAGAAISLFVWIGSGVNPPLIAINAVIAVIFLAYYFVSHRADAALVRRLAIVCATGAGLTLLINLYWLVPFLDYMHTVWLAGVLDESPLMHNADSSFANVFRGLGQWAIFQTGAARPYYPWGHAYQTGQFFSFALWLVPLCGFAGLAVRARAAGARLFFLAVAVISIPLAVGYYRGPLGVAITEPVYNLLYSFVPGFQMFRSAYKWVGGYEFGVAGLFAIAVWLVSTGRPLYRRLTNNVPIAVLLAALPLLVFVPIIINKENYPLIPLPAWTSTENAMSGGDPSTRVAIFPGQFLERFLWGEPNYYLEHALIHKPMTYGYLGAATNEAADEWLRLAYRRAREGCDCARSIFRTLSVASFLQRDDFRVDQDFAFPDTVPDTNATVAHDVLTRVLDLRQQSQDGANRLYPLPNSLPLVFGATHPRIDAGPAVSVPTTADTTRLAAGEAHVTVDGLSPSSLQTLRQFGAIAAGEPSAIDDYATTLLFPVSPHIEIQHPGQLFTIPRSGRYRVAAINLGFDYRYPLPAVRIGAQTLRMQAPASGVWQSLGAQDFTAGVYEVSSANVGYLTPIFVVLENERGWRGMRSRVRAAVGDPAQSAYVLPVKGSSALARTQAGTYALRGLRLTPLLPLFKDSPIGPLRRDQFVGAGARISERELPYIPLSGVVATKPAPLPEALFAKASTFAWNRGAASQSWLLTQAATFKVFSSARVPVHSVFRFKFSSVVPMAGLVVESFGQTVTVRLAHNTPGTASSPTRAADLASDAQEFAVPLTLHHGANRVTLRCACSGTVPQRTFDDALSFAPKPYFGALLNDMAFVARSARGETESPYPHGVLRDLLGGSQITGSGVAAAQVPFGGQALYGEPFFSARVATTQGTASSWIASLITENGRQYYRIYPAVRDVSVALLASLPNSATDNRARLNHLWFIMMGRGTEQISHAAITRTGAPEHAVGTLALRDGNSTAKIDLSRSRFSRIIDVPLAPFKGVPPDATAVALASRGAQTALSLEYQTPNGWRLIGNSTMLSSPVEVLHGGGAILDRYQLGDLAALPHTYAMYASDGRELTEGRLNTLPSAQPAYALDVDRDGKVISTYVAHSPGGGAHFTFVSVPLSWVNTSRGQTALRIPAYAFDDVPLGAALRLRVELLPDQPLLQSGTAVIDRPRVLSWRSTSPFINVLVDGKEARGPIRLTRTMHRITAVDSGDALDLVELTRGAPPAARRVPLSVRYISPVRIDVTLTKPSGPFILVLNQEYYAAWNAHALGRLLTHVQANGFANGWLVPAVRAGTVISLDFSAQRKYEWSVLFSVFGFAIATYALLVGRWP